MSTKITCKFPCSLGKVERPSGAKALICGEDPRWLCCYKKKSQLLE